MTANTLKLLSLPQLDVLMVKTVEALILMAPKAKVSAFRAKEKEITLIHAAIALQNI